MPAAGAVACRDAVCVRMLADDAWACAGRP